MDERPVETLGVSVRQSHRPRRGPNLAMDGTRYPIVSEDGSSCLIEAPNGARIRGVADIYDGERHRAHCLVVLSRSEGKLMRVLYKRRTAVRQGPPSDFATEPDPEARSGLATTAAAGASSLAMEPADQAEAAAPAIAPATLAGAALIAAVGLALVGAAPGARIEAQAQPSRPSASGLRPPA
jgi:hypothetical protein